MIRINVVDKDKVLIRVYPDMPARATDDVCAQNIFTDAVIDAKVYHALIKEVRRQAKTETYEFIIKGLNDRKFSHMVFAIDHMKDLFVYQQTKGEKL